MGTGYINGYTRKFHTMGALNEEKEQLNPLPRIGSFVRIEEIRVRATKDSNGKFHDYQPCRRYFDPWGIPKLLKVIGYSKGMHMPYDRHSYVYFEWTNPSGKVFYYSLHTLYIACGNMRCVEESPLKENEIELFLMREGRG